MAADSTTGDDASKTPPALATLHAGDEIDFYKITDLSASRLVLKSGRTFALILICLGLVGLFADFALLKHRRAVARADTWLYEQQQRTASSYHVQRSYRRASGWYIGTLFVVGFGFPLLGMAGAALLGRGYTLDVNSATAEQRKFLGLATRARTSDVAEVQLRIENLSSEDYIRPVLVAAAGSALIDFPSVSAGSEDFAKTIALAAQLRRQLQRPLRVVGAPAKMSPAQAAAIQLLTTQPLL